jgi:hypothetical protein
MCWMLVIYFSDSSFNIVYILLWKAECNLKCNDEIRSRQENETALKLILIRAAIIIIADPSSFAV